MPNLYEEFKKIASRATPGTWFDEDKPNHWCLFAGAMQLIKAPKRNTPYAEYWPTQGDAEFIKWCANHREEIEAALKAVYDEDGEL